MLNFNDMFMVDNTHSGYVSTVCQKCSTLQLAIGGEVHKSTEELKDRIKSSYKVYLDEVNADKNNKQYQETIQELEEKGKKINGIKKG